MYIIYNAAAGLIAPPSEGCLDGKGKSWSVSNIAGGRWQHCHFWEDVLVLGGNSLARLTTSSSDDVV